VDAVLWLWSPVPDYWSRLSGNGSYQAKAVAPGAVELAPEEYKFVYTVSERFGWLEEVIEQLTREQLLLETQLIAFIQRMDSETADSGPEVRSAYKAGLHGQDFVALARAVVSGAARSTVSAQETLTECVFGPATALLPRLQSEWKRELIGLPLSLRRVGGDLAVDATFAAGEWENLLAQLPEGILLRGLNRECALALFQEVLANTSRYAERLERVVLELTDRYLTVILEQQPTDEARAALTQGANSFESYYAIRRGLISAEGLQSRGRGLGLAVQSVLGSHLKVYQKFYLAPDGSRSRHVVALPIVWRRERG